MTAIERPAAREVALKTLVGLAAVLMWATLGLFTAATGEVPPFLLNALCFALSGALATLIVYARRGSLRVLRQPWRPWLLGVGGLFGFHALYFTALKNAPPVEANLVNYTWPLLIVLFSGLLPGERLRWFHLAGAGLGFAGAALILAGGDEVSFAGAHAFGYAAAIGSALVWSSYSVLSRRFAAVPTDAVAGFCLATAALSALCHLAFEATVWPAGAGGWLAVAMLAAFPVGAAFFCWDAGVKGGNIQVLGAAAYLAPLLSTVLLIAFGFGAATWQVAVAAALITGGGLLAARSMLPRPRPR